MMERPRITDPDLCIVHTHKGERICEPLARMLDPIDPLTLHQYVLPARTEVELHGHDFDEYWWFTAGHPTVTLWTPVAGERKYQLVPGDLVVLVRGMAHTLWAEHSLTYHQFSSVPRPGARQGHLLVADLARGAKV